MRLPPASLLLIVASACGLGNVDDNPPPIGPPPPHGDIDAGPGSPDASGPDASPPPVTPPVVDAQIVINEVMAANSLTIADEGGFAPDWIELYNPTDRDIRLDNYGVTNNLGMPRKATIGANVMLPAHGRVLLWLDGMPSRGPRHIAITLAKEGGDLGLTRPDGTFIDRVQYGAQEVDFSAMRVPDGSSAWRIEWKATPGEANLSGGAPDIGPEVMTEPPEQIPAAGDLSQELFDPDLPPTYEILVSPEGVASLEAQPFTTVPATLVYQGRHYGPIGVRLKGQNSFEPFSQKPSLRLKIDEYTDSARFFGLKDMTLNNMDNDRSMMHERMAYLVSRLAGVPASRANHALLTVNGQFYGLYTQVETVKHRMLERWYPDPEGPLFEGTDVDFAAAYVAMFDLESGPDDRAMLTGLADALTIADPDAAITAASAYADIAAFQRFWAMCSVIGQYDSLPYSNPGDDFFVYADPTSHRLRFMPWGMDETFYSSQFDVTNVRSVLATQCKASPACFQGYVNQVWEIVGQVEAMNWTAEHDRIAAQIAPYVTLDTRKPYDNATVTAYQTSMRRFITERRTKLTPMIPPASP